MAELTAQSDAVVFENSVRIEVAASRVLSSLTVRQIPIANGSASFPDGRAGRRTRLDPKEAGTPWSQVDP
jgi:hypothetical protein